MNIQSLQSAVLQRPSAIAQPGARIDLVSDVAAAPVASPPPSAQVAENPVSSIPGVLTEAENQALVAAFGRINTGYSQVGRSQAAPPVLGAQLDLSA